MSSSDPQIHTGNPPFDVDAVVADLAARVTADPSAARGLTSFSADFTGAEGMEVFEVEPDVHESTKPVLGPVVTRGKRMVARASAPMVAGLGEQIALSLAEIHRLLDVLTEEQRRLRAEVAALEQRLDAHTGTDEAASQK